MVRPQRLRLRLLGLALCAACAASPAPTPNQPSEPAAVVLSGPSKEEASFLQLSRPPASAFVLAFGSCSKPDKQQPLWAAIRALKPQAWLWLGDIVYADTEDPVRMRELYTRQSAQPEYAALVASTPIFGIWDDHDYGTDNAGKEHPRRPESQAALLDFLREPAESPRRAQQGVYASYVLGDGARSVKLILLDGRYHRDAPGPGSDTLGKVQWQWLENELRASTSRLTFVVSGYQVLPEEYPGEKWADFPAARQRLFQLLASTRTAGVVLLTGDRHFAEVSRVDDLAIGYPLYELTSSGLTEPWQNPGDQPNRYRAGALYAEQNFGLVVVDWERDELALEIRGLAGIPVHREKIRLATLRPAR